MKGHDDVINMLNEILTAELTVINVYFLHARMCEHWGYLALWEKFREESIDEMRHADLLIERILHLEGLPNLQRLGNVKIGETVPEQLQIGLSYEQQSITKLNEGIELCRKHRDNHTCDILEMLLKGSEEAEAWLDAQLNLVNQVGEANYLAQQILPSSN